MNNVVSELDNMLQNLSINQVDNIIERMENMSLRNNRDSDVEGLIMSMNSLNTVPNNKKLQIALNGVKEHKRRIFAKKYKSLSGRKSNISNKQIDDIFATMEALKDEDSDDLSMDDIMADINMAMDGGAKKRKKKQKKKPLKGGAKKKKAKKPTKKPRKKRVKKSAGVLGLGILGL